MSFWDKNYPREVHFRYNQQGEWREVMACSAEEALSHIRSKIDPFAQLIHFQIKLESAPWRWLI